MRKLICPGGVDSLHHDHGGKDLPHWHVGWSAHGGGSHGPGTSNTLYDHDTLTPPSDKRPLRQGEIWVEDPAPPRGLSVDDFFIDEIVKLRKELEKVREVVKAMETELEAWHKVGDYWETRIAERPLAPLYNRRDV